MPHYFEMGGLVAVRASFAWWLGMLAAGDGS